jgi:hypothetical protein
VSPVTLRGIIEGCAIGIPLGLAVVWFMRPGRRR